MAYDDVVGQQDLTASYYLDAMDMYRLVDPAYASCMVKWHKSGNTILTEYVSLSGTQNKPEEVAVNL